MKLSGIVKSVSSQLKTAKSSGRSFRIHYAELESGEVINVGFSQPFKVGDSISVDVETKFGELKVTSSSVAPDSGTKSVPVGTKPYAPSTGKNTVFPVPNTHGDYAIIRQNALTAAVNAAGPRSATGSDEEYAERVIKMAYKFAEFTSGHREKRIAREQAAKVLPDSE